MNEFPHNVRMIAMAAAGLVFVLLLLMERIFPLRMTKRPVVNRLIINIIVTALSFTAGAFIVKPVVENAMILVAGRPFGLLQLGNLPNYMKVILGFLLMDLTYYYWHRANHTVSFLWRFHNIHHIDPDMDVSTSFRFHFGEVILSALFRGFQISLLGISVFTYAVFEIVFQFSTMFHHSNIKLPLALERVLNMVIVTPRMHGIHHSSYKPETNSNYSVVFRWWDYLNRSLVLNVRQADLVIGIDGYLEPKDNSIMNIITLPFLKQNKYWPEHKETEHSRDYGAESGEKHKMLD
jgi:sterol desaturase/sphingolipid hydroxylase (fatty acid hydroxylase superfamily)